MTHLRDVDPRLVYLVGGAAALWLLWQLGFFRGLGRAAVNAAGDLAGGVAEGLGEQVGLPRTNKTECDRALEEGRTWDASFVCPAGAFLDHVFSGSRSRERVPGQE